MELWREDRVRATHVANMSISIQGNALPGLSTLGSFCHLIASLLVAFFTLPALFHVSRHVPS